MSYITEVEKAHKHGGIRVTGRSTILMPGDGFNDHKSMLLKLNPSNLRVWISKLSVPHLDES